MLQLAHALPEETAALPAAVIQLADYRGLKENWNILLVEDDPSDVALTEIALNAASICHATHTVASGREVLQCLNGRCDPEFHFRPDVVFLDLSLPDKDGFQILAEIAAMPRRYHDMPFIILTGSEHYQYLTHSYGLWMPIYLTKPCSAEKMREAFEAVKRPDLRPHPVSRNGLKSL